MNHTVYHWLHSWQMHLNKSIVSAVRDLQVLHSGLSFQEPCWSIPVGSNLYTRQAKHILKGALQICDTNTVEDNLSFQIFLAHKQSSKASLNPNAQFSQCDFSFENIQWNWLSLRRLKLSKSVDYQVCLDHWLPTSLGKLLTACYQTSYVTRWGLGIVLKTTIPVPIPVFLKWYWPIEYFIRSIPIMWMEVFSFVKCHQLKANSVK